MRWTGPTGREAGSRRSPPLSRQPESRTRLFRSRTQPTVSGRCAWWRRPGVSRSRSVMRRDAVGLGVSGDRRSSRSSPRSSSIAGVAGVELVHDNQATSALESRRVTERLTLTAGVASYISSFVNPSKMLQPISSLPWSLSSAAIDEPILLAVTRSPLSGPHAERRVRIQ